MPSLRGRIDLLPLQAPTITHRALFDECVSQTQRLSDRAILDETGDRIEASGTTFAAAAAAGGLAELDPIVLSESEDRLIRQLYDSRLVSKEGRGRWAYDKIRTSAKYCPYCTFGEVYEVDHFMPKLGFRELNICPTNLIPICHPCNHIKLSDPPEAADRYLLHPYYDRLPNIRWLFADLGVEAGGPVLRYRVALDPGVHGDLAGRLAYHFRKLELDRRFQERSAKVLIEIEADLTDLVETLGAVGMQEHFSSEAARHFSRHGNSLESAAYLAASLNADFCAGEFRS